MKRYLLGSTLMLLVVLSSGCSGSDGEKSGMAKMADKLQQSKYNLIEPQISSIENAVNAYLSENDEYPESPEQLVPKYLKIESHIVDPWGTPFRFEFDNENSLFLVSAGRDLIFGTEDDVRRRM